MPHTQSGILIKAQIATSLHPYTLPLEHISSNASLPLSQYSAYSKNANLISILLTLAPDVTKIKKHNNTSADTQLNITHLIYGFVPDNLITFIKKFQFNQKSATSIAHKMTYWFALQAKLKIWNARCTTQINADKHNNILKKHKIHTTNRSGRP
ncbi:1778_t:CDS:2, partial [Ambispora gerdemannii]